MPFCPKCKYEYKEGVIVCSDCGVELVDSLKDIKIPVLIRDEATIREAYDFLKTNDVKDIEIVESTDSEGLFELRAMEDQIKTITSMLNVYYREVHVVTEEEAEIIERTNLKAPVARYIDSNDRAENYRSGASVLIGVGIIGAVVLTLSNIGVINLPFPSSTKTLINVVMGALFFIFIIVGITSYISYKKYKSIADSEDNIEDKIDEWADNELNIEELTADEADDTPDELKFFSRTEKLREKINEQFPDLEESFKEHIIEDLYDRIFGCE